MCPVDRDVVLGQRSRRRRSGRRRTPSHSPDEVERSPREPFGSAGEEAVGLADELGVCVSGSMSTMPSRPRESPCLTGRRACCGPLARVQYLLRAGVARESKKLRSRSPGYCHGRQAQIEEPPKLRALRPKSLANRANRTSFPSRLKSLQHAPSVPREPNSSRWRCLYLGQRELGAAGARSARLILVFPRDTGLPCWFSYG
jgi:hypothetical protein